MNGGSDGRGGKVLRMSKKEARERVRQAMGRMRVGEDDGSSKLGGGTRQLPNLGETGRKRNREGSPPSRPKKSVRGGSWREASPSVRNLDSRDRDSSPSPPPRPGHPRLPVSSMKCHGVDGFWVPKKSFDRFISSGTNLERRLQKVQSRIKYVKKRPQRLTRQIVSTALYVPREPLGVPHHIQQVFSNLEKNVPGWVGPPPTYDDLIAEGAELDISLAPVCSSECLQLQKGSKKRADKRLRCMICHREFHVKCMREEGTLDKVPQADLQRISFSCKSCGGSKQSNMPSGSAVSRVPLL